MVICLVVTGTMEIYDFPFTWEFQKIPTDEVIFFRGVGSTTNQHKFDYSICSETKNVLGVLCSLDRIRTLPSLLPPDLLSVQFSCWSTMGIIISSSLDRHNSTKERTLVLSENSAFPKSYSTYVLIKSLVVYSIFRQTQIIFFVGYISHYIHNKSHGQSLSGWWFGTFWECHNPNWRTHIFQRGTYTTNQLWSNPHEITMVFGYTTIKSPWTPPPCHTRAVTKKSAGPSELEEEGVIFDQVEMEKWFQQQEYGFKWD